MNLSNLRRADDIEVRRWMEEALQLTTYQKERLRDSDIIRFSPFEFYKPDPIGRVSFWWRFTILVYPIYLVLALLFGALRFLAIGQFNLPRKFLTSVHYPWIKRLKI